MLDPSTAGWPLTPEQAAHLDQACDAFEAAWLAGQRPAIEQHHRSPASVDLVVQPQPVDVGEGTRGVNHASGDTPGRASSSGGRPSELPGCPLGSEAVLLA